MPAPAAPAAEVTTTANGVDPEKAKQLTQAVTEQVRWVAGGDTLLDLSTANLTLTFISHFGRSDLLREPRCPYCTCHIVFRYFNCLAVY